MDIILLYFRGNTVFLPIVYSQMAVFGQYIVTHKCRVARKDIVHMNGTFAHCGRLARRKSVLYIALCYNSFIIHLLPSASEFVNLKFFLIVVAARGKGEGSL